MTNRQTDKDIPHPLATPLTRIAEALDRLAPARPAENDLGTASAFVWHPEGASLTPVHNISRIDLDLLRGIDEVRDTLLLNTRCFAKRLPANNALLWGARGTGKSSLVKAIHGEINRDATDKKSGQAVSPLILIEIHREDISTLPTLLNILRNEAKRRILLFCDDLSFDSGESDYKSLKAVLEGGIEGRPENVLLYATSNRRHMMPRDMIENERGSAINPSDAVNEKVSLSDRFGLWLGFHVCDQETYFAIVEGYVKHFGLKVDREKLLHDANQWSVIRGGRSGRVAWQFIQDLAGRKGKRLNG